MRSLARQGRWTRAATPDGGALSAALRRGRIGRTFRRVSRGLNATAEFLQKRNGTTWAVVFLGGWISYGMALGGQSRLFLDEVTAAAGFAVSQIEIRGLAESDSTEIVDRIDVTETSSLLMLDAEKARSRIAEIPWLADVTVKKVYPAKIVVSLRERKPYALWQDDGRIKVVDQTGAVMSEVLQASHADLPLVVGQGANTRAAEAIALIKSAPSLRSKIRAAVLVAERRWNLVTVDGVEIRLPEENPAPALGEMAKLQETKKLLERDIDAVDLRTPDRLYIKLSDAAANARKELIKQRLAKKKATAT
ncbi:cell division protein FtsQ/DivIB [Prosthecomicrobium sp. N25]|uniref:cell division protein FtsQ/DivIB n=1 Tax=Prosthecomicrobium sp. N25 TaxID=3129254 RepID=UPI003076CD17